MGRAFPYRSDCPLPSIGAVSGSLVEDCVVGAPPDKIDSLSLLYFSPPITFEHGCFCPKIRVRQSFSTKPSFYASWSSDSSDTNCCEKQLDLLFVFAECTTPNFTPSVYYATKKEHPKDYGFQIRSTTADGLDCNYYFNLGINNERVCPSMSFAGPIISFIPWIPSRSSFWVDANRTCRYYYYQPGPIVDNYITREWIGPVSITNDLPEYPIPCSRDGLAYNYMPGENHYALTDWPSLSLSMSSLPSISPFAQGQIVITPRLKWPKITGALISKAEKGDGLFNPWGVGGPRNVSHFLKDITGLAWTHNHATDHKKGGTTGVLNITYEFERKPGLEVEFRKLEDHVVDGCEVIPLAGVEGGEFYMFWNGDYFTPVNCEIATAYSFYPLNWAWAWTGVADVSWPGFVYLWPDYYYIEGADWCGTLPYSCLTYFQDAGFSAQLVGPPTTWKNAPSYMPELEGFVGCNGGVSGLSSVRYLGRNNLFWGDFNNTAYDSSISPQNGSYVAIADKIIDCGGDIYGGAWPLDDHTMQEEACDCGWCRRVPYYGTHVEYYRDGDPKPSTYFHQFPQDGMGGVTGSDFWFLSSRSFSSSTEYLWYTVLTFHMGLLTDNSIEFVEQEIPEEE